MAELAAALPGVERRVWPRHARFDVRLQLPHVLSVYRRTAMQPMPERA